MIDIDGRPLWLTWDYDRTETFADGIVHALGIVFGIFAIVALVIVAAPAVTGGEIAAIALYGGGLAAMLGFSAAYNLWPVSPWKWMLRRLDHSAIYLLIAGTYTPFLVQLKTGALSVGLLVFVWSIAFAGIALKLFLPGRFDRLSLGVYLALGWSGIVAYDAVVNTFSGRTLALLALGGAFYSVGVIFHAWRSLRFQNAIWHAFVLTAAICHYFAVLDAVALSPP